MTKTHYIKIAQLLAAHDFTDNRDRTDLATEFAAMFAADNPRFDRVKFLSAVHTNHKMDSIGRSQRLVGGAIMRIEITKGGGNDAADRYIDGVNYIAESFWQASAHGIEIVADVLSKWPVRDLESGEPILDEEGGYVTGPMEPDKSYWFFGDNCHVAYLMETGLEAFGLESVEQIEVYLNMPNGEQVRLAYKENPNPGCRLLAEVQS